MSDELGVLDGFTGMTLSKLFIQSLNFFLGEIMIKDVKMPSTKPMYSDLVPPRAPVHGLREITPAIGLTMRHIQLYLIICKKLYSGRVMHSLSRLKANIMSEKPLPKIRNCVTLSLHLMPSRAGPLLCGSWFHPLPAILWLAAAASTAVR